ncbi:N1-acetylpolyamine oxidase [Fusarium albosuccineum]|uniref:Amine oxidase n=1 Tax=Fusarium albosuccineum TaxID=1237068 RepID=A0A8H4L7X0_9HYPO|nr:N1-acetylpolyamine oxidase [Fusarium albosuccineum]
MRPLSSQLLALFYGLFLGTTQAAVIPHNGGKTCKKTKVAVLGAGVSGITAAQTLHNASIHDFVIVEHNDYIGGRVKHASFGKSSDGKPLTVELGANWIEGLGSNPIWRLAQKHKVKNTYSDGEALLTYDQDGPANYSDAIAEFDEAFEKAAQDAGYIQTENLQDTSVRAGLSLAGWKPKQDQYKQTADWWGWDFEAAIPPEQSGFQFGIAGNNATFKHFSDETNLVIDQRGYNAWIIGEAEEFLKEDDPRLLLNTTVKKIHYGKEGVIILNEDDSCIEAEFAICTFSVGVLQNEAVTFDPVLPRWKREAIEQFQMGTYIKIFMQFNESFWDDEVQYMLYADPDERGYYPLFQSLNAPGFLPGSNILFSTVVASQAYKVEAQSDEETKEEMLEVLRSMFPDKDIPEPTDFMYPRWTTTEWAYGSYSNWPVGMTLEKHQNLRANVDRLWFAGEANSAEFFGYLHGAYFEGQEAGDRIARIIGGKETEKSQQMKQYHVLHGTTTLDEYNGENGWSTALDD